MDVDGTQTDREYKTNMARELLTKLGYENMFDAKSIDRKTLEQNILAMKGTNVFAEDKNY